MSFVVAVPQAFDNSAFSALLSQIPEIELIQCLTELDVALGICPSLSPDSVIIDVSYPDGAAFEAGRELLESKWTRAVAYFDARFAIWRAYKALSSGVRTCYFTRNFDLRDLCKGIRTRTDVGNSFISTFDDLHQYDRYKLLSLSVKELNVMQWLASGHSIRSVAEKMGLAESTVDNHKSRVMKKLSVHRSSELVRIAVETGLVDWV